VQTFYDNFWKPRKKRKIGGDSFHKRLNKVIASFLGEHSSGVVLDLGCGDGYLVVLLAKSFSSVIGIDVSRVGVRKAWKWSKANEVNGKCNFIVVDASHLPFKPACFDTIVMREVVEHLTNQMQAMRDTYRLLKPLGSFILSTPNRLYLDVSAIMLKLVMKSIDDHGQIIENQLYPAELRSLVNPFYKIKKEKGILFEIPIVSEYLNSAFLVSLRNLLSVTFEDWNFPSILAQNQCILCSPRQPQSVSVDTQRCPKKVTY
jgi:2-polyprenyl-3-methyl-5-hydroxy-6-metoxy-1,4-benzoquinol methylase